MAILHLYLGRGYFEGMSDPQVRTEKGRPIASNAMQVGMRARAKHAIVDCVMHSREYG